MNVSARLGCGSSATWASVTVEGEGVRVVGGGEW